MVEVGDHYRPGDGGAVYRVVGTGEPVALLRVTDADGRRAHTGDLRRVAEEELESEFASAGDPDAGLSPVSAVRNALQGLYWSVRRFL